MTAETETADTSKAVVAAKEAARNSLTTLSSDGGGIVFHTVAEARDIAYLMAGSDKAVRKHLRNNPGACFGIVIQAVEWGLSPYAVANKSYEVNDQLAYESQLIQAVILRRAPIKGRIRFTYEGEGDQRVCIASATPLDGSDPVEYRTPVLARITPKNSPLWKNDPDQQLAYFAGRSLCRRHFPDVLMGIYDVDEIEGSTGMRTVGSTSTEASGLADRLAAAKTDGGFNPEGINATLAEVNGGGSAPPATSAQPSTETPASEHPIGSDAEHDPEVMRAGATAARDGAERHAPDDLSPADVVAWLTGYDEVQAAQLKGKAA